MDKFLGTPSCAATFPGTQQTSSQFGQLECGFWQTTGRGVLSKTGLQHFACKPASVSRENNTAFVALIEEAGEHVIHQKHNIPNPLRPLRITAISGPKSPSTKTGAGL
jgi:hypothetical protein